eukprot:1317866-Pleurochrysis_carterae.AAC.1
MDHSSEVAALEGEARARVACPGEAAALRSAARRAKLQQRVGKHKARTRGVHVCCSPASHTLSRLPACHSSLSLFAGAPQADCNVATSTYASRSVSHFHACATRACVCDTAWRDVDATMHCERTKAGSAALGSSHLNY